MAQFGYHFVPENAYAVNCQGKIVVTRKKCSYTHDIMVEPENTFVPIEKIPFFDFPASWLRKEIEREERRSVRLPSEYVASNNVVLENSEEVTFGLPFLFYAKMKSQTANLKKAYNGITTCLTVDGILNSEFIPEEGSFHTYEDKIIDKIAFITKNWNVQVRERWQNILTLAHFLGSKEVFEYFTYVDQEFFKDLAMKSIQETKTVPSKDMQNGLRGSFMIRAMIAIFQNRDPRDIEDFNSLLETFHFGSLCENYRSNFYDLGSVLYYARWIVFHLGYIVLTWKEQDTQRRWDSFVKACSSKENLNPILQDIDAFMRSEIDAKRSLENIKEMMKESVHDFGNIQRLDEISQSLSDIPNPKGKIFMEEVD